MGLPAAALLLLLLLDGPTARPAAPRARRHSDGAFTSELSRLREGARLQRLLQGLVGKRSEQDAENRTAPAAPAGGQLCLLWSRARPQAWTPLRDPLDGASRGTFQAGDPDLGASFGGQLKDPRGPDDVKKELLHPPPPGPMLLGRAGGLH